MMFNKKQEISKFKHIAVLQTAFIGDIVLSFYLLEKIKELHPNVKLSFITTKKGADISSAVQCIDNLIIFDKKGLHKSNAGLNLLAKLINKQNVDCIISLHKSYRTTKLVAKLKAKFKIGYDRAALSFLVYNYRQIYHPSLSEIQRNLSLLNAFKPDEKLDLDTKNLKVRTTFSEKIQQEMNHLLGNFKLKEFIVVAPGSVWATKRYPAEHYAKLIELMLRNGEKVILTGSTSDEDLSKRILQMVDAELISDNILDMTGSTSLLQTLYLLSQAKLTITNDSGPTHLSELAGTPTATFFGPTSPIFGFAPHLEESKIIELEGLSCRPCEIHGSNKCPIKTHVCMQNLIPEEVLKKIFINY